MDERLTAALEKRRTMTAADAAASLAAEGEVSLGAEAASSDDLELEARAEEHAEAFGTREI